MTHLVTDEDLNALCNIGRFNGHTIFPYSVMEHLIIGGLCLVREGAPRDIRRAWLLHDIEEHVFGDRIRPNKHKYMNARYFRDVEKFERDLYRKAGLPLELIQCKEVVAMDNDMLAVELSIVADGQVNRGSNDPAYRGGDPRHQAIYREIWQIYMNGNIANGLRVRFWRQLWEL